MADTKKEHYVPRCYLKNFIFENDRIKVFDKFKMQEREQRIMDVAMENYFYDIKIDEIIQKIEPCKQEKIKADLIELLEVNKWEDVVEQVDEKHLEKEFFSQIESVYSELLQIFIDKSYEGNDWVMKKCLACSEIEKTLMAFFIAIQTIRTKSFRDNLRDTISKTYQALVYKSQMNDVDALPKEAFECDVNPDFVKLQHSSMILNEEMSFEIAETLCNHIWVMYVNKTKYPFYTSDNPIATIPHKHDEYMSYGGLKSEGIEIVFPISSKLLLAMYEKTSYDKLFSDRQFYVLTSKDQIDYFNCVQVYHSYRCIFSGKSNFELAKEMCKAQPELQEYQSHVEVG